MRIDASASQFRHDLAIDGQGRIPNDELFVALGVALAAGGTLFLLRRPLHGDR